MEQRANACKWQGEWTPGETRLHQQIKHKGAEHFGRQVFLAGEGRAGIAGHLLEAAQMGPLQLVLGRLTGVLLIPWCPRFWSGDVELLAMVQRQPGFPLRVGERGAIALQKLFQRKAFGQLGILLHDGLH